MPLDILLIEDDPAAGYTLSKLLTYKSYAIGIATTCAEAITLAKRKPRIAIVDLMLPDAPGETLIGHLRDNYPACKIVVWTALAEGERLDKVRKMGVSRVIPKPLSSLDDLIDILPAPRMGFAT